MMGASAIGCVPLSVERPMRREERGRERVTAGRFY